MSLYSAKDASLAARVAPYLLQETDFMGGVNDYLAVNQPPVPLSNVIGASFYTRQLDASGTQLGIDNSAANTVIYSQAIAGGTLRVDGGVRLLILGDYKNNSGSNKTFTLTVKYGSSTLWQDTSSSLSTAANYGMLMFDFYLVGFADVATQQRLGGLVVLSSRSSTPTVGYGPISSALGLLVGVVGGLSTENADSNLNLSVEFQHSAADPEVEFHRNYVHLSQMGH